MTLIKVPYNAPSYRALSTDIVANKITGASYIGALVYITDLEVWYQIMPDLTLSLYSGTGGAYSYVSPVAQTSTNSYANFTGSTIDSLNMTSISYTIYNTHATYEIQWKVLASDASDFSGSVEVKAEATVNGLSGGTYSTATATYRYYKVQIKSLDSGEHASVSLSGISKA